MTDDFSARFFSWFDSSNMSLPELATALNNKPQTLSNWRSIGIPKGKRFACQALMEKSQSNKPSLPDRINVEPNPDETEAWSRAFKASPDETLQDWMIRELNEAAEEWHKQGRPITSFPDPTPDNVHDATLIVHGAVAAGSQIEAVNEHAIAVEYARPEKNYGLVVCGQSMEPDIADGSIIEVEPLEGRTPRRGSIVVYTDGYGSSLKRLQLRKAKPSEKEFADRMGNVKLLESINPDFNGVEIMEEGRLDAKFVQVIEPLSQ